MTAEPRKRKEEWYIGGKFTPVSEVKSGVKLHPKGRKSKHAGMAEPKAYWSKCGQIFFTDGDGFGLDDDLTTVYLGKEEAINDFLTNNKIASELNQKVLDVLEDIKEYRRQNGYEKFDRRNLVGTGNNGTARGKQKTTRLSALRKRIPLRQTRWGSRLSR